MMFRRSQTRTTQRPRYRSINVLPSSQSNTFSYHEARQPRQNMPRGSQPEQGRIGYSRARHATIIIIGIVLLIGIIYDTVLTPNPKVVISTGSSSTLLHSPAAYQQAAKKLFSGRISDHDKLTIDTVAIATELKIEFPELANVTVTLPLVGRQPVVNIEPAKPALVLTSLASGNFLIDSDGRVLLQATPQNSSGLSIVTAAANPVLRSNQIALAASDVDFIKLIVTQFQGQHVGITSMTLPQTSRELDVVIQGQTYYVKFNLNDSTDARQQIGTFLATRQYLSSHNITPSQYIDARIPGRVYYK